MTEPLVSVVIATYRRSDSLLKALESVEGQRYRNFEIVISDDSDDLRWNTENEKVIESFKLEHPQTKIVYFQNHPNLGSAMTRNKGIEMAGGTYICFLDDDDIYLPDRIGNQLNPMINEDADYSLTDLMFYSDSGNLIETRKRDYIKDTSYKSLLEYHLKYHMAGTDTMMFKKTYLSKIGGFAPIDLGDEYYLMLRAIEGKGKFLYVRGCDMKAFVHTGEEGLSSGKTKIKCENQLYEYKKQYFAKLSRRSIRYIKMRHHAVLAFAYLRMKKYIKFATQGAASFFTAPVSCIKLLLNR